MKAFTENQLKAINLLATGIYAQSQVADICGVNVSTIQEWRKIPEFIDAMVAKARLELKSFLPEMYEQIRNEIRKGKCSMIKVLLDHIDNLDRMHKEVHTSKIQFSWENNSDNDTV